MQPANRSGTPSEQLIVFGVVLWVVAIATACFSAVNERELRRRHYDLEALAAMAARLEDQSDCAGSRRRCSSRWSDAFGFARALLLGRTRRQAGRRLMAHTAPSRDASSGPAPARAR